nr:MAG TPA: hypothetical protein [Caudoviricetes sp.]
MTRMLVCTVKVYTGIFYFYLRIVEMFLVK